MGSSWLILGRSWGLVGASWSVLGCLGGVLGHPWRVLGASWGILACLGGVLGASWAVLGASRGSSWRVLGLSWGDLFSRSNFDRCLDASWVRLGSILGPLWGSSESIFIDSQMFFYYLKENEVFDPLFLGSVIAPTIGSNTRCCCLLRRLLALGLSSPSPPFRLPRHMSFHVTSPSPTPLARSLLYLNSLLSCHHFVIASLLLLHLLIILKQSPSRPPPSSSSFLLFLFILLLTLFPFHFH